MAKAELHIVRATLRALERNLVVDRAEQRVCFRVEELVKKWRWAIELGKPIPDPMEFIGEILDEGIYLPTFNKTIGYMNDCQSGSKVPEGKKLFQQLLP